jgi:hypothetical protein
MNHTDSLIVALMNISGGMIFLGLVSRRRQLLVPLFCLFNMAMILLMRRGIYADTGWAPLETASRIAMAALIAVAAGIYIRNTLKEGETGA